MKHSSRQDAGVMYGNEYLFVPCAVGLTVGRLLHLGTVVTFMLGRIFNMVDRIIHILKRLSGTDRLIHWDFEM